MGGNLLQLSRLCIALAAHVFQTVRAAPVDHATRRSFDYVVIGGGTAGLTVAARLSEDPSVQVAVIEAGTFYEQVTGNQSQVPAYDFHYNGKSPNDTNPLVEWGFVTTPQAVSLPFRPRPSA